MFLMKIILWQVIKNHPNSLKLYEDKLLGTGEVSKEDVQRIHDKVNRILNEEFAKSKDYVPNKRDWLAAYWTGFKSPEQISRVRNTG
jgi:2-oxoglutarate dehydrogenase E1 component